MSPAIRTERGFTLVELLIYMSLMVVVVTIVGGILINSLSAERTVRTTSQATSAGQLIAQSIDQGVRNASYISPILTSGSEQFFTVRTAGSGASLTWSCQAWYITTAGTGAAYYKSSATVIPSPIGASLAGWTKLTEGLAGVNGAAVLSKSGTQVSLGLEMSAGDSSPILIQTTAVSRQTDTRSTPCA